MLAGCTAPAQEERPSVDAPSVEGTAADSLIDGTTPPADAPSSAASQSASASSLRSDQGDQASRQEARIDVYNGSYGVEGLAARGAEELQAAGFAVSSTKNTGTPGYGSSLVVYRSPAFEAVAREAARQLGIATVHLSDPDASNAYAYEGDVAVILCEDWAEPRGLAS